MIAVYPVNVSSSGDNSIIAAAAGTAYRIIAAQLHGAGAVNVKFRSGTTDLHGAIPVADLTSLFPLCNPVRQFYFQTAANAILNLNLSGNVAVTGYVVVDVIPALS